MSISVIVAKTSGEIYKAEVDSYKDYYKHLECDCFDVIYTSVNGINVNVFVDDEALFKPKNLGWNIDGQPIFGHLVFTGLPDEEGETQSVDDGISLLDIYSFIQEPKYITKG